MLISLFSNVTREVTAALLFLAATEAADFILARQSEGIKHAGGIFGAKELHIGDDDIPGAHIDAAAGHGGAGPDRRRGDLPPDPALCGGPGPPPAAFLPCGGNEP